MSFLINPYNFTPAFDAATIAWLTAAGVPNDGTVYFSGTNQQKTGAQFWIECNKLIKNLKGIGAINGTYDWWSSSGFKAFHASLIGNATASSINAKNPGTNDITYSAGWTHGATGSYPNGTSAYATFGLAPTDLNGSNVCFGRFNGRQMSSAGSDIHASDGGSDAWELMANYLGTYYFYTNTSGLGSRADYNGLNFYAVNRTSAGTVQGWRQNQKQTSANTAATVTTLLTLGCRNASGIKSLFGSREMMCNWVIQGLSDVEMGLFKDCIYDFNYQLGRRWKSTPCYGDSITYGTNAMPITDGWFYKVCANKNWINDQQGLSGRTLQRALPIDCPTGPNGYDYIVNEVSGALPIYVQGTNDYVFIALGVNDAYHTLATYTSANFITQGNAIAEQLHNVKGFPYANIIWINLYYINPTAYGAGIGICTIAAPLTSTILTDYRNAVNTIAATYGCTVIDSDIGTTGADGIHPDTAEHATIATTKILPALVTLP